MQILSLWPETGDCVNSFPRRALGAQSSPSKAVDLGNLSPDSVFYNLHSNIYNNKNAKGQHKGEADDIFDICTVSGKFKMGKVTSRCIDSQGSQG